jgi:hypothetical protein
MKAFALDVRGFVRGSPFVSVRVSGVLLVVSAES